MTSPNTLEIRYDLPGWEIFFARLAARQTPLQPWVIST